MSERTAYRTRGSDRGAKFFVHPVQDAVDEPARLLGPELLGDLDGLVDRDLRRHLRRPQELVDGEPEDVAVDDRHPLEIPVLRELREDVVHLSLIRPGAVNERVGERARIVVDGMARPELLAVWARIVVAVEVELIQELERDFASFPALAHGATASRLIGVGHVPDARGSAPPDDHPAGGSIRPFAGPPRPPLPLGCPRPRPRVPTPALPSAP